MFSSSIPVWYYPLAAYCLFFALIPLRRFPRAPSEARRYGRLFGTIVRRATFVLAAAGLLWGWSWPIAITIVFLLLSLPGLARQFALGMADARAGRLGAVPPAGAPHLAPLPSFYVAGATFALLVRGVPVALLLVALLRIAGAA